MINLNELTPHHPAFHNIVASYLPHTFAGSPQAPNPLKNDLREPRKSFYFPQIDEINNNWN